MLDLKDTRAAHRIWGSYMKNQKTNFPSCFHRNTLVLLPSVEPSVTNSHKLCFSSHCGVIRKQTGVFELISHWKEFHQTCRLQCVWMGSREVFSRDRDEHMCCICCIQCCVKLLGRRSKVFIYQLTFACKAAVVLLGTSAAGLSALHVAEVSSL